MRTLYFGDNEYKFPDSWYDLTPDQYPALVAALLDYTEGIITAENARAIWFCAIADIDPSIVMHPTRSQLISENIYRASREFTFFFKLEYSKSIDHLSREVKKLLYRFPPSDLMQTPEIRWASTLKYKYIPDISFATQLVPELRIKNEIFNGYQLTLKGNILDTNLKAQQYIDANIIIDEYYTSSNYELLNDLLAILYFPGPYDPEKRQLLASKFEVVNTVAKHAVLLNFQAFTQFLARKTKYGIMWHRTKKEKTPEVSVGFGDTLYSLAKLGYGTVDELSHINLMTFLDLSLKNIIDSVSYLHENDVSIIEISDKTGLPVSSIQKLIA